MRAPLVISGRQVHRPPPAGWMRAECILARFPLGEGKRLVSLSRPWNFHSLDQPCLSECEQRFAQFIIDLHADSSYIIRPRFLGLERFQRHQDTRGMDAVGTVLQEEVFLTGILFFRAE